MPLTINDLMQTTMISELQFDENGVSDGFRTS